MEVREALHPIIRTDSIAATADRRTRRRRLRQHRRRHRPGAARRGRRNDSGPRAVRNQRSAPAGERHDDDGQRHGRGALAATRRPRSSEVASTAQDAHALLDELRPDLEAMAQNGRTISNDTSDLMAKINGGQRHDRQARQRRRAVSTACSDVGDQAQEAMANLRQVSDEARRAIADFRRRTARRRGCSPTCGRRSARRAKRRRTSPTTWRR